MHTITLHTHSEAHTQQIAKKMANIMPSPALILLHGDLGAGKTTFVQGFASGLKQRGEVRVQSPTYSFVRTYPTEPVLHHLDLYRVTKGDVPEDIGLDDMLAEKNAFVCIEWPTSRGLHHSRIIDITIAIDGHDGRQILITFQSGFSKQDIQHLEQQLKEI